MGGSRQARRYEGRLSVGERCLRRGLSRVLQKAHARFLGGRTRVTASGYPTPHKAELHA
jgi:hypothetical protein